MQPFNGFSSSAGKAKPFFAVFDKILLSDGIGEDHGTAVHYGIEDDLRHGAGSPELGCCLPRFPCRHAFSTLFLKKTIFELISSQSHIILMTFREFYQDQARRKQELIICCLCPFIGRYFQSTPFGVQSWFYYKCVYDYADRLDRVAFCGYEKNFPTPDDLKNHQKYPVFLAEKDLEKWRYKILDQKIYEKTIKRFVPEEMMECLVQECGGSVFQAWRRIMTEPYAPLVDFYRKFLKKCAEKEPLEFIRATANDASMSVVAAEFKIPFVHCEKGPLRQPDYLETAYWDLSGVNGSTECEKRRLAAEKQDWKGLEFSREELLFLFCADNGKYDARIAVLPQDADAGVAGQVDDDSNVIAYSHGYTNFEALQFAENLFPEGKVIARRHPSGRTFCAGYYDTDASVHHFIQRVGLVICINSSVAFEAVLMGKKALILGESPFMCLSCKIQKGKIIPPDDLTSELNFILLNYLVPVPLADSLEYTKWRLSKPSELEIRKRHLNEFLKIRGFRNLEEFRKAFKGYRPAPVKEQVGSPVYLEPASVVRRTVEYPQLEKRYQELCVQYDSLGKSYNELLGQHKELKKTHDEICAQHGKLGIVYNNLLANHTELEKKHASLSASHSELEQARGTLSARLEELKKEHDGFAARYAELEKSRISLDAQYAELKKTHDEICAQHGKLGIVYNALLANHTELEKTYALLSASHCDLEQKHGVLSARLNELQKEYDGLAARQAELEKKYAGLCRQNLDGGIAMQDLQNRYMMQDRLLNELKAKLSSREQELQKELPQLLRLGEDYGKQSPSDQRRNFYALWSRCISSIQDQLTADDRSRDAELRNHELTLKIQKLETLKKQFMSDADMLSGWLSEKPAAAGRKEKKQ